MPQQPVQVNEQQEEEVKQPKKSAEILEDLEKIKIDNQNIDAHINEKLSVLDVAELEYMKNNYDYMKSMCITMPQVLKVEALHEKATDLAKEMAQNNLKSQELIDSYTNTNQELQYEFDEKQDELKELFEKYQAKKALFTKQ